MKNLDLTSDLINQKLNRRQKSLRVGLNDNSLILPYTKTTDKLISLENSIIPNNKLVGKYFRGRLLPPLNDDIQ